jgi:hypothetical protein
MSKLAVTPNPVEVKEHQFVAPQPTFDITQLPGGAGGPAESWESRRITLLEQAVRLQQGVIKSHQRSIDQLEDALIKAGIMADTRD